MSQNQGLASLVIELFHDEFAEDLASLRDRVDPGGTHAKLVDGT